jgi:hypothetical protein
MAILLNLAGGSAGDPGLKGLSAELVFACTSFDVDEVVDSWFDQAAGFPGSSSIKSSLSPASTVVTAQLAAASYDDTTKRLAVSSTTGLSVGDYIYASGGGITAGVFKILTIPDGTHLTFVSNPWNGGGDQTGISWQVAWKFNFVLGTSPSVSSSGGTLNYAKFQAEDSLNNAVQQSDTIYIRDPLTGTAYIAIGGHNYDGSETTTTIANTFALLGAWTNKGGVSHIAFANHSGQGVNNFTWGDNSTSEKAIASALSSGLKVSAGDGMKYGRLLLRSLGGSSNNVGVDIAILLDSTAPAISLYLFGR